MTEDALAKINKLAGTADIAPIPTRPLLSNPEAPHPLDPLRGVDFHSDSAEEHYLTSAEESYLASIVPADSMLAVSGQDQPESGQGQRGLPEPELAMAELVPADIFPESNNGEYDCQTNGLLAYSIRYIYTYNTT